MENQAQKFTMHLSFPATKMAFLSTAVWSALVGASKAATQNDSQAAKVRQLPGRMFA
jgi:hypothetical protein